MNCGAIGCQSVVVRVVVSAAYVIEEYGGEKVLWIGGVAGENGVVSWLREKCGSCCVQIKRQVGNFSYSVIFFLLLLFLSIHSDTHKGRNQQ